MEKVSIIIPAYNAEKYLEQCLNSVCEQTYKNIEILIVNDGSTDSTGKIIEKYASKDSRIQFFHNENHGVSYSRNYAIEHSTGTYIAPVDSDDIIAPGYIEILVQMIEKYHAEMAATGVVKEKDYNPTDFSKGVTEVFKGDQATAQLWGKYEGFFWGKIYLANLIKQHSLRMNEKAAICEDLLFNVEYMKYCDTAVFYSGKQYFYRQVSNSATYNLKNLKWFSVLKTYRVIMEELKDTPSYNTAANAYLMTLTEARYRAHLLKKEHPELERKVNRELKRMSPQMKNFSGKEKIKFFLSMYFAAPVMAYHRRKV